MAAAAAAAAAEDDERQDASLAIDLCIVFDARDTDSAPLRSRYEKRLRNAGLVLQTERVGFHGFVKVHCPFDRLCYEAEQVKLEMSLKDCAMQGDDTGILRNLMSFFETDDEVDFVSGPFNHEKLWLFEGADDQASFFRSAQRSLLVHHCIIHLDPDSAPGPSVSWGEPATCPIRIEPNNEQAAKECALPYLLMKGVYKDCFILHDRSIDDPFYKKMKVQNPKLYQEIAASLNEKYSDARKDLNRTWTRWFKFQPLWKIRNYFGEKIALYFAWQGLLLTGLWLPAIIGVSMFCYGLSKSIRSSRFSECKCFENTTINGVIQQLCVPKTLTDLLGDDLLGIVREAFNNEGNPYFSFFICIWGAVFIELWKRRSVRLVYEWDCDTFESTEPDRAEFVGTDLRMDPITKEMIAVFPGRERLKRRVVSSLVVVCMARGGGGGGDGGAPSDGPGVRQRRRRHHDQSVDSRRLQLSGGEREQERGRVRPVRRDVPYGMPHSRYAHARYGARRIRHGLGEENPQTQSEFNDALILKLFAFQFVNHYAVLFYMTIFRPEEWDFQAGGIFGLGERYKDTCPKTKCMSALSLQVLLLMCAKPTVKFFNDIIFPLAVKNIKAVWTMKQLRKLENSTAIPASPINRPTSSFLMKEWQKPPAGEFDLGEFTEKVMQFGYLVMFAAAFPLAPLIALLVNFVDLRIDARRLLWFNRRPLAKIAADIGMWQHIIRFLLFCGVATNGFVVATRSTFTIGFNISQRLITMILFENVLILLIFLVEALIPDTPAELKQAMRREKRQVSKILADGFIARSLSASRLVSRASLAPPRAPSCNSMIDDGAVRRHSVCSINSDSPKHLR